MWDLNLGVQACQKISSHFDIDGVYMLHRVHVPFHRTMTIHIGCQGFYGSYAFRCCIGLKLFLRLARATCEENTNLGFFGEGLLLSEV